MIKIAPDKKKVIIKADSNNCCCEGEPRCRELAAELSLGEDSQEVLMACFLILSFGYEKRQLACSQTSPLRVASQLPEGRPWLLLQ